MFLGVFLSFYFLPIESTLFTGAIVSGLGLLNEYAREHVLSCLVPAFFIAGAIAVFVKKELILKYLGGKAKKMTAYSLASVSGGVLAVCSCTILPMFAGIRKRGAGLGPAITFLFSGPAINIAAIFLTISVLGLNIGLARIFLAIPLAVLVGLSMQFIFKEKAEAGGLLVEKRGDKKSSPSYGGSTVLIFMTAMVALLVVNGLAIDQWLKYFLTVFLVILVAIIAVTQFKKETRKEWLSETWSFAKTLLPLLFVGVFIAGFIMPFLPQELITDMVGSNSLLANLIASGFGAFMYFSTLTEVPILQTLMSRGMHSGPALALLLAGPSLSLPNMLVIRSVLGNKRTFVYILLVLFYSTLAGFGAGYLI